ncbi:MAG: type II toxin-antitoxin system prevent-host-death family antitoxin [Bacteroidetes bacterium]|nr:type II toxin-antitoxin system prevent-host-death family antitoxin [Bacteroidota bacterium]
MTSVSMTDLKANLSRYIREVRRGGEVEVLDRGTPVALITKPKSIPKPSGNDAFEEMIRAGVLTRGNGCAREILDKPLIDLGGGLSSLIIEDREDRV